MPHQEPKPLVWIDSNGYIYHDSRISAYLQKWMDTPEARMFFVPFSTGHAVRFGWIVYRQLYSVVDIVKEMQRGPNSRG